jgi:hypothetical protein
MRIAPLVALSMLTFAAAGAATAQELATVEVRASEDASRSIVLSCTQENNPSLQDVDRVLLIQDPTQSAKLRTKLVAAAAEACAQNEPRILVQRGQNGGLTWKPLEG